MSGHKKNKRGVGSSYSDHPLIMKSMWLTTFWKLTCISNVFCQRLGAGDGVLTHCACRPQVFKGSC